MTEEKTEDRCLLTQKQGRLAAGADPVKRVQIIEGAKRVFMRLGFDAASVNEVCREAGVSKATIYVYFENKEDLFSAIVEDERQRFMLILNSVLTDSVEVEAGLYRFGVDLTSHVTSSHSLGAIRMLIGVATRMPHLCSQFFHSRGRARAMLEDFVKRHIERGNLIAEDPALAANQFIELASGSLFNFRLFGNLEDEPPWEEVDFAVKSAIRIFMAAYANSDTSRSAVSTA
ncbi:AcrR family transcriptional regulator [Rhizobium petrolearium]|uniref:TetR/AcrR family transcriptional regulator n=2 Tax=Neorhizobium TaxID=1525371 RepID=A0ABV0MEF4_9HYPH|nr:TetR/AcrR family transcriptional regulator [Neorhizobium petrolearium]MBP1848564.1 AcrR family transcriptional regulator [Neorhizobium petrolearium]MCC2614510.1 TetR/AcrR family transcriptional regulator [Neorhizobium petrolearium]WGI72271.1 TetR/AcrR family transcriptional regulator [Neorhizobium petrolearium]